MSELSLIRHPKTDAEGILIPQSEFTCWQYGINHASWWYTTEPSWVSYTGSIVGTYAQGMQFYSAVSWKDGVITFSNPFTPNYDDAGYIAYSTSIYRVKRSILDGSSAYGFLESLQRLAGAAAPSTTYQGLVFSKDPNKYPNNASVNGVYYSKKTGTTFNLSYW